MRILKYFNENTLVGLCLLEENKNVNYHVSFILNEKLTRYNPHNISWSGIDDTYIDENLPELLSIGVLGDISTKTKIKSYKGNIINSQIGSVALFKIPKNVTKLEFEGDEYELNSRDGDSIVILRLTEGDLNKIINESHLKYDFHITQDSITDAAYFIKSPKNIDPIPHFKKSVYKANDKSVKITEYIYKPGEIVEYLGKSYICILPTTDTDTFSSINFIEHEASRSYQYF